MQNADRILYIYAYSGTQLARKDFVPSLLITTGSQFLYLEGLMEYLLFLMSPQSQALKTFNTGFRKFRGILSITLGTQVETVGLIPVVSSPF